MKRVIVTPAGRKKYMELLAKYLSNQRSSFDEWHIWQNTTNLDDIAFFRTLDAHIISPEVNDPTLKNLNLNNFYLIDSYHANTVYLKLDDDIVWMEPNFIDKMFSLREFNNENFLIFANTVNNSVCSHLHMRFGNIPWNDLSGYNTFDSLNWSSPLYAESIHNALLNSINNYNNFYFHNWYLFMNERVSINAVAWRGEDFSVFQGFIDGEDEHFLTFHGPSRVLNKRSMIYGQCLCSHYSYKTQMTYLDSTDILSRYQKLV